MKRNHLVPATVSIVCLVALSACSTESSMKSSTPSTTSTTTTTTTAASGVATTTTAATSPTSSAGGMTTSTATTTTKTATNPAGQGQTGGSSTAATQVAQAGDKSAPAKAPADPNNVSNLKPYAPPKMAPGFPGKGDPAAWVRATKYFNDGIDLSAKKKYADAIKQYNQAVKVYPYSPTFYTNLGFALERNSEAQAGVDACNKAIALDKSFGGAWENLGNCEYDLSHLEKSRDAFNEALKCELTMTKRNELLNVVAQLTKKIEGH